MLLLSLVSWWYSRGFIEFLVGFKNRLKDAADFFSLGSLVRNFFSPFKQISVGGTDSLALNARIQAFFDLLISRVVGATIRFFLLIGGIVVIIVQVVVGLVLTIVWPLLPLVIVYGVMLYARGVVF